MKYVIMSDIHSNIEALQKVMYTQHEDQPRPRMYCCGDIVGYNADPVSCISLMQSENIRSIMGNHDCAVAGIKKLACSWEVAHNAVNWTKSKISPEQTEYLRSLPQNIVVTATPYDNLAKFVLFHGTLEHIKNPQDLHLEKEEDIFLCMQALLKHPQKPKIGFFGHTHRPVVHKYTNGVLDTFHIKNSRNVQLMEDSYYLINPGSVGQPRDGDKRASYLTYDSERENIRFCRVDTHRTATLKKAKEAGLLEKPLLVRYFNRAINKARKVLTNA